MRGAKSGRGDCSSDLLDGRLDDNTFELIEAFPSAVAVFDHNCRVVAANPLAWDVFGLSSFRSELGPFLGDLLDQMVAEGKVLLGEEPSNLWRDRMVDLHRSGGEADQKLTGGRMLRVECAATSFGIIGIYTDVTDLRHRQRELKQGRERLKRLNEIGLALSGERNVDKLLEMILGEAQQLCRAEGGTIYLKREKPSEPVLVDGTRIDRRTGGDRRLGERRKYALDPTPAANKRPRGPDRRSSINRRRSREVLEFAIVRNGVLGIEMGGTSDNPVNLPKLSLYDPATGEPNRNNVATYAALTGTTVNIPDAYHTEGFDFSGTRRFDEMNSYHSASFLTVPLKSRKGEIIGVLQLINARDQEGHVVPFDFGLQDDVEALASQVAVALDNNLLLDAQRRLFEALMKVMANAIDRKSPYTGGHCTRVPALTEMLAQVACEARDGPFASFDLDQEQKFALHVAGWLHDIGKVVTPQHVMDKATKLETIHDRIDEVATRFAAAKGELEIAHLRALTKPGANRDTLEAEHARALAELDDDLAFVRTANVGSEFMAEEKKQRIARIAARAWTDVNGQTRPLLTEDEVYNLCIERGTLTGEERKVITDHMEVTIEMLEQLPFPKSLSRVIEFAGGHHEKVDGTGYPRGLSREQMSIPARIMAIADIFEALTAADRPYKEPKTLSASLKIMAFMKKDGHIDPDLFDLFVESGVYRAYADRFLAPEQIDEIDVDAVLGRRT